MLNISNAKKLSVSEELYALKHLKILCLSAINPIESLDFLKYFPKLETFIFMETNILDGDLTPILEHPTITYVGIVNKRHYNIKREKLKELLAEKN